MVLAATSQVVASAWVLSLRAKPALGGSRKLRLLLGAIAGAKISVEDVRVSRGPTLLRGPNGPRRTNYGIRFYRLQLTAEVSLRGVATKKASLPSLNYVLAPVGIRESYLSVRPLSNLPLCKRTNLHLEELALINCLSQKVAATKKKKTYTELSYSYFRRFRIKFNIF